MNFQDALQDSISQAEARGKPWPKDIDLRQLADYMAIAPGAADWKRQLFDLIIRDSDAQYRRDAQQFITELMRQDEISWPDLALLLGITPQLPNWLGIVSGRLWRISPKSVFSELKHEVDVIQGRKPARELILAAQQDLARHFNELTQRYNTELRQAMAAPVQTFSAAARAQTQRRIESMGKGIVFFRTLIQQIGNWQPGAEAAAARAGLVTFSAGAGPRQFGLAPALIIE